MTRANPDRDASIREVGLNVAWLPAAAFLPANKSAVQVANGGAAALLACGATGRVESSIAASRKDGWLLTMTTIGRRSDSIVGAATEGPRRQTARLGVVVTTAASIRQPDINQVIQMERNDSPEEGRIAVRLREILLDLARREDDMAHAEAASVPYWAPQPISVVGHREAAISLRFEADRFLQAW